MILSGQKLSYQQGFTLVEVMIAIAIVGILLVIGVPLTAAWVNQAKVDNASASMKTAIIQARAAGLRNANNQLSTSVASSVCIDSASNQINVFVLDLNSKTICPTTGTPAIKSLSYPNGVSFQQNATSVTGNCFAFDTNGLPITLPTGSTPSACATSLDSISATKNGESANVNIL